MMATCKECLHVSVCEEVNNLKCRKQFAWYRAESGCPHFKPVKVGKWYKEPLPTPENAKNTTMKHFRLVCPFCGRRNGKKREKFCADCGAILK